MLAGSPKKEKTEASSLPSDSLRKMGAAYRSYRSGVIDLVANIQNLIESAAHPTDVALHKIASSTAEELFTPLTFEYLNNAFMNGAEFGDLSTGVIKTSSQADAGVQRGFPSRNTW